MKLTCKDCNCYRILENEPIKNTNPPAYNGICLCHGYHIKSNEEICVDFER